MASSFGSSFEPAVAQEPVMNENQVEDVVEAAIVAENEESNSSDSEEQESQNQVEAGAAEALAAENEAINSHEQDDNVNEDDSTFQLTEDRSLVADLHSHLNDQDIADVTLIGTDNRAITAVRSILAMRSKFFKSLLFGSFQESTSSEVKLGYSSLVIKAVVEYCYTDEIKTAFENLSFEETARSMVGLVAAGAFFDLKGLQSQAHRLTCLMMDEYPGLACAVLDEVSINNETSELGRVALGIIRLRTESSLLPPDTYGLGVQSLGEIAMERVIADSEIQTQELTLFLCLKKWAEYETGHSGEDRRAAARKMAAHIRFSNIEPSVLATTVQESGLVPMELLLDAYRSQALYAERKGCMTFSQTRSTLKRASTGNILVLGAGLTAVNGTYTSGNTASDAPLRYFREGTLPGFGDGTFVLQTLVLQDDSKKWFLSFLQYSTNLDLYSSPVLSDTDPPPMQTWLPVVQGHEKFRQSQDRFPARRKHTTFESSFSRGDDGGVGDPPPICIWLPNDSSQR